MNLVKRTLNAPLFVLAVITFVYTFLLYRILPLVVLNPPSECLVTYLIQTESGKQLYYLVVPLDCSMAMLVNSRIMPVLYSCAVFNHLSQCHVRSVTYSLLVLLFCK